MNRKAVLGLILLVTCVPIVRGASAGGVVAGVVLDPDGQGISGVNVTVAGDSGAGPANVVSGYGGVFRVSGLPPGRYQLVARLDGFAATGAADVDVQFGRTASVRLVFAKPVFHEMVEVTAKHDSLTVTEVRESSARDLGEALASVPGIVMVRRGGIANDVAVRGLQRDNVNVLIDGERIHGACPNRMDSPAFHVDFAEIEFVEVTKGPFDVENQGSLGGVVNIVTRKADPGWHALLAVAGGSYGFINPSAVVSRGGDTVSATAGYSFRTSGPYRDGDGRRITEITNYAGDRFDSRAFQVNTGWGKVYLTPGSGHTFELSYTRQEANPVLYPGLQMDANWDNTDRANLGWQKTNETGLVRSLRVRTYATRVHHWMTDERRTSGVDKPLGWSMGSMAKASTLGGKADAEIGGFHVGVEAIRRGWDMSTQMAGMKYASQASIPDVKTTVLGAFARRAFALRDALRLDLGARLDRTETAADSGLASTGLYLAYNSTRSTSRIDTQPGATMRLTWEPSARFSLSSGLGRTTRIPDPAERYLALKRSGSDWVGNPDVKPTRNTGGDLQVTWRQGRGTVNGSVFYESLADFIAVHNQPRLNTVAGVMNQSARSYANTDARMWGAEVEATHSLSSRLFLAGSLAWTRGEKDTDPLRNINSPVMAEIPPLTSRLSLRWDTGRYYVETEAVLASSQNRVDSDLQEDPTPGWSVFNLKAGTTVAGVRVQAILSNLFNREYAEHLAFARDPFRAGVRVYEPGRSLTVSASKRF